MRFRFLPFLLLVSAICSRQSGAFCFNAGVSNPPSDLYVAQAYSTKIASQNPGTPNTLPLSAALIAEDAGYHSQEIETLDTEDDLILKAIDYTSHSGSAPMSYPGLRLVRGEIIVSYSSVQGGTWSFRGTPLATPNIKLNLETENGAVLHSHASILSAGSDGIAAGLLAVFPLDTLNPMLAGGAAYLRVRGPGDVLLGSKRIRWECERPDCRSSAGTAQPGLGSIEFDIPFVAVDGGAAFLEIGFRSQTLANPGVAGLNFHGLESATAAPPDPQVTRNASRELVSVTASGYHAAVVTEASGEDPNRFRVTISSNAADPATSVFRTVIFENVQIGGATHFRIADTLEGKTTETLYRQPTAETWEMTYGNGLGRLTETTTPGPGDTVVKRRIQEEKNAAGAYTVVGDVATTTYGFPWGKEITREVVDPDGLALATLYDYYEAGENTGPPGGPASAMGLGRLQSITRHDGSLESHYYYEPDVVPGPVVFQSIHEVHLPFGSSPQAKVIRTMTGSDAEKHSHEWKDTFVNGTQVGKIRRERLVPYDSDILGDDDVITRVHHGSGENDFLETREQRISNSVLTTHPDGTRSYEFTGMAPDGATGYTRTVTSAAGDLRFHPNGALRTDEGSYRYQNTTFNFAGHPVATLMLDRRPIIPVEQAFTFAGQTTAQNVDVFGRPLATAHASATPSAPPAYTTTRVYNCCGLAKERDMLGIDTFYTYDDLRRPCKAHRLGVTTEMVYNGLTTSIHRYPETVEASLSPFSGANPDNEIKRVERNLAGQTTAIWTRSGEDAALRQTIVETTHAPAAGLSRSVTITPPSLLENGETPATRTTTWHLGGTVYQTTGNLGLETESVPGANETGIFVTTSLLDNGNPRETTIAQADWSGRPVRVVHSDDPEGPATSFFYNTAGQLVKSTDADGVAILHAYNERGELTTTATDLDDDGEIDPAVDRVATSETRGEYNGFPDKNAFVLRTLRSVAIDDPDTGQPLELTTLQDDISIDGLKRWRAIYPGRLGTPTTLFGMETISITTLDSTPGSWQTLTTAPDKSQVLEIHTGGRLRTKVFKDATGATLHTLEYAYNDPLFRLSGITDSRIGTTTFTYVSPTSDLLKTTTDPLGRVTTNHYDTWNRLIAVDAPDTIGADGTPIENISLISYNPDGSIRETSGDGTYRQTFTYDYAGRPATLTTYGTHTATTRWTYDPERGWPTSKKYDSPEPGSGSGTTFTSYTPAGRLLASIDARGITTTRTYHPATGELTSITHDDGTPGQTILSRDRLGRVTALLDDAGEKSYKYSLTGSLLEENHLDGPLAGFAFAHSYDTLARPSQTTLKQGGASIHTTGYAYDSAGRHSTITSGNRLARYLYDPLRQTPVETRLEDLSGNILLRHTRSYDANARLIAAASHTTAHTGGEKPVAYTGYTLNRLNQRTGATGIDGRHWDYGYNPQGELVRADHRTSLSGPPLAGRQFRYHYDGVGNRTVAESGGDPNGENRRILTYSIVKMRYDSAGRLYSRESFASPAALAANQPDTTTLFLRNGWNTVAEYSRNGTTLTLKTTYLNGLDVSGSLGGSGGIGGLLAITSHSPLVTSHYPVHDGNGNLTGLIDGTTWQNAATYEYGPFGETLRATGPEAAANRLRYSGKFTDPATGLLYFGHRWYDPETGRWLTREPLGESESVNLYAYCHNDPINKVDVLGLYEVVIHPKYHVTEDRIGGYATRGIFRTVPQDRSEAMTMLQQASELMMMSSDALRQETQLGLMLLRQEWTPDLAEIAQDKRRLAKLADSLDIATSSLLSQLEIYNTYADASGLLTDVMFSDVARNISLTPQLTRYVGGCSQDLSILFLLPQGRALLGGEFFLNSLDQSPCNHQATTGAALILANVRNLKNIPVRVLARELDSARTPLTPNPYVGVQEASAYLRTQGVPRNVRKQVIESFDVRTIGVRQAGASEYGLRYFDNVDALAKGRYLFETFPASRASLALDPQWNKMTNFTQWQIRPGATLFEGVASPQGVGLPGGQIQKFVPNLKDLLSP